MIMAMQYMPWYWVNQVDERMTGYPYLNYHARPENQKGLERKRAQKSSLYAQRMNDGSLNYPSHNPFVHLGVSSFVVRPEFAQQGTLDATANLLQCQGGRNGARRSKRTATVRTAKSPTQPVLEQPKYIKAVASPSLLTSPVVGEDLIRSPYLDQKFTPPAFSEPTKTSHVRRRSRRIAEAAFAKNQTESTIRGKSFARIREDEPLNCLAGDVSAGLGVLEWDGIVSRVDTDLGFGQDLLYGLDEAEMTPLASPSSTIKSGLSYSPPTTSPSSPYMKNWTDETYEDSLGTLSPDILAMLTPELIGFLSPDLSGSPFEDERNVYTSRQGEMHSSQYIDPGQLAPEYNSDIYNCNEDLLAVYPASRDSSFDKSEYSTPMTPGLDLTSESLPMLSMAHAQTFSHKRKRSLTSEELSNHKRDRPLKKISRCQNPPRSAPSREPSVESHSDQEVSANACGPSSEFGHPRQDISAFYEAVPLDRSFCGSKPMRKYECLFDGCHRIFPRRTAVTAHIMTHLKDKPFVCPDHRCGAAFVRQHDLRRHERIHNSVKSFTCPCGKGFSRGDALMRHRCRGICIGSTVPTKAGAEVRTTISTTLCTAQGLLMQPFPVPQQQ